MTSSRAPTTLLLVRTLAERTCDACVVGGRGDLAEELRDGAAGLDQVALPVALIGPSDSGKSTLLNALLNEVVSPVDPIEATSVPVIVRAGRGAMSAGMYVGDEDELEIEPIDVGDVVSVVSRSVDAAEGSGVLAVEVQLERAMLSRGLILVDVPSLQGQGRGHRRGMFDLFGDVAVLVVLDASQELDRTWVDVLVDCRRRGQWCGLVFSKADLAWAWRVVVDKAVETLAAEGVGAPVLATSARLRQQALRFADRELNASSGVPALMLLLLDDALEAQRRRVFVATIDIVERCLAELRGGVALTEQASRSRTETVAEQMQELSIRFQRLQSAKSEFPRRLNERLEQLQIDFDTFVNRSLRDVSQVATEFINTQDPAAVWAELAAMVNDDLGEATDRLFAYLRSESDGIATEMSTIIGAEFDQLVGDLGAGAVRAAVEQLRLDRFHNRGAGRVEIGLDTLRGSVGGTSVANLVVGAIAHFTNPIGWALAPFSLAFTLLLGRKSLRLARENRIGIVRRAALQQFSAYFTEVQSEFSAAARREMATNRHRIRENIERQFTTLARALDADRQSLKRATEAPTPDVEPGDDVLAKLIDLERAASKLRFQLERIAS